MRTNVKTLSQIAVPKSISSVTWAEVDFLTRPDHHANMPDQQSGQYISGDPIHRNLYIAYGPHTP